MTLKHFFLILALCLILPGIASATISVSMLDRGQSYITWTWPAGTALINGSVDGVMVYTLDPNRNTFTLSELPANESHTFTIYTTSDTGSNTTSSLPDTSIYAQVLTLIYTWWYLVLITVFVFIGMGRKMGFFLIIASMVSLYALAAYIGNNPVELTDITHLPFLIYVFFFVFPYVLIYMKGGWMK